MFDGYIGIDYSGRETPEARTPALQIYRAEADKPPHAVHTPAAPDDQHWNWNRQEIAEYLAHCVEEDQRLLIGLDHGFSFPVSYYEKHGLESWDAFLADFAEHWPTDKPSTYVDFLRDNNERLGDKRAIRLTESWTSSAKGVFQFDVQGQVAKSTHAGLPWLRQLRLAAHDRLHVWPIDGWELPDDRTALVEIFPSLFRRRYPKEKRTTDQHDAYITCRWLQEIDRGDRLATYLDPPLTPEQRERASIEGWILGVM